MGLRFDGGEIANVRLLGVREVPQSESTDRRESAYREVSIAGVAAGQPERRFALRLRAYDTGAAFRLEIPRAPKRLLGGTTEFRFPTNYDCMAVAHSEYLNSHEGDYAPVKAAGLKAGTLYDLPLTCRTGRGSGALALTESDVENYPGAYLVRASRPGAAVRLTPLPANDRFTARVDGLARTPWRIVMVTDRPERLIENRMVQDLASPSRIGDVGWVRSGKAAWAWWSGIKSSGVPDAGFNNATYRHYVDFAARFGLPYFVIDWGWAARPNGAKQLADVTRFREGVDIVALARYAQARGVRLWLWVNWEAVASRMEALSDQLHRLLERGV